MRNIIIRLSAKHSGKQVSAESLQIELESDFDPDAIDAGNEDDFVAQELKDKNFHLDAVRDLPYLILLFFKLLFYELKLEHRQNKQTHYTHAQHLIHHLL